MKIFPSFNFAGGAPLLFKNEIVNKEGPEKGPSKKQEGKYYFFLNPAIK
ncbi:hypothetical protein [Mycoplasma suis]|nr:hypothetical protein [Mycoplasma suis]